MRFKKLLVIPVVVATVGIASVAFAAWTSTGSGTGEARSTTSVNSVIAPGANDVDLYPGAVDSVTVTISNPNPYPIVVNSISAGSSAVVNTTCIAGTVTTDVRTAGDATGLVQADTTTKIIAAAGSGTYTLVTRMAGSAVDACKLQTFSAALTATISSAA